LATTSLPRPDVSRVELQATAGCLEAHITPEVILLNKDSLSLYSEWGSSGIQKSRTSSPHEIRNVPSVQLPSLSSEDLSGCQIAPFGLRRCHADFQNL
jgi:hypothetical protein